MITEENRTGSKFKFRFGNLNDLTGLTYCWFGCRETKYES